MAYAIELTIAICLVVLGVSYLLQSTRWLTILEHAIRDPQQLFPLALGMVGAGVFIGAGYNDWSSTWPVFITLLGWLMAAEGALILVFPGWLKSLEKIPKSFLAWYLRLGGMLLVVLGLLLLTYL